jgi:hypothetical protein
MWLIRSYIIGEVLSASIKNVNKKIDAIADKISNKCCNKIDLAIDKLVTAKNDE